MATTSNSSRRAIRLRNTSRPMRPKPLIATRIATADLLEQIGPALAARARRPPPSVEIEMADYTSAQGDRQPRAKGARHPPRAGIRGRFREAVFVRAGVIDSNADGFDAARGV